MCKDVKCTFGILKGRWRILKAGVRIHGVDGVDDVWLACCELHYWLLDIDGLNGAWGAWRAHEQLGGTDGRHLDMALDIFRCYNLTPNPRHHKERQQL
jgi:hypothetical protein